MVNDLSLVIYIWSALSNWITQLYYLIFYTFYDHIAIKIIYLLIVSMIIYDDVFLMKYLYKNTKYIPKQEDIEEFKNKLTYISENNPLILYKNEMNSLFKFYT